MLIKIAGLVPESYVDGPGIRFAIFMQGCHRHCDGCHNPITHDPNAGFTADTDDIISQIKHNSLLHGITLTGGEPFLQPVPAIEIAQAAKNFGLNVWCYTGFTFDDVKSSPLLNFVDVLVDGEFRLADRDLDLRFRGSRNQRLIDVPKSLAANKIILWEDYS